MKVVPIPDDLASHYDGVAARNRRSRAGQVEVALREWLSAGQRRRQELEHIAAETIAASNAPAPASTAGEDHLREHRRLAFPEGQK